MHHHYLCIIGRMISNEESMCEEIGIETLFAGVRIESSAAKSVFDNLDTATQNAMLVPEEYLISLEGVLKRSFFVPAGARRFLEKLAKAENISFQELFLPTSVKRYIAKQEREGALRLLMKWKPLILVKGKEKENEFFLRNGQLTTEFSKWARERNIRGNKYKDRQSSYAIKGQMTYQEFASDISKEMSPSWQDCGIRYVQLASMVDESIRFGDPYSLLF